MFEQKPLKRILTVAAGVAFLGVMVTPFALQLGKGSQTDPQTAAVSQKNPTNTEQLQARAAGYEQVLAREPHNPIALKGLAETRLQLNDLNGAIAPLEKLSALYPEQAELQSILAVLKEQTTTGTAPDKSPAGQVSTTVPTQPTPSPEP